ncbi:MAG: cell division/cell wall cluster transcriptional repressor MraZ [Candidatus Komeilibacteria bacterium CG11_big_fil_rev_8_21_14_0_20_36_20]|uniref:Transcriptional regulator MraZ n=2 Tax=Patescibacteria group TaxID=1783273 RepID=A0A2H0NEA7_9BACT|nr:MAG: cell division/cell wall cluster transcriptional repressor MraZ [Candidatus Komeilibacteria bacterium CG11_big_fil_rev_8_21_14_0_20_36_20]PIR81677.1 MAG: cell division/cell wall cluster transcriptional repressor MraZ [Candidatus Komeilibacteria bacterium CG10_big_fil_rev_8_21_14_0_10_36_65]PJC55608.1 MAG: cell division/cell wall cluster transcriptional repressor MraZ [Candidatus Komeilibacteria bacterium CG_4_9_14_0_2_um_filter_36_13]
MFIGEYKYNLDDKNRLAIPSKFRKLFAGGAVITKGLDNCLFIYTAKEWDKLVDKLANLPISQAKSRAFSRMMLAGAMDVRLDGQGRMVLPDYLKDFASLDKKIIVAGLYNRLEIWDEKLWAKYQRVSEKDSNQIAEGLVDLGI